jgi:hypothetical protein
VGAGSGEGGKTQTARRERHQKDKSARSSNHKLFPWQHHHDTTAQPTTPTTGQ